MLSSSRNSFTQKLCFISSLGIVYTVKLTHKLTITSTENWTRERGNHGKIWGRGRECNCIGKFGFVMKSQLVLHLKRLNGSRELETIPEWCQSRYREGIILFALVPMDQEDEGEEQRKSMMRKTSQDHSLGHFWLKVLSIPNEEIKTVLLGPVWVCLYT